MSRRLVGYLWRCEDTDCSCSQPVMEEQWTNSYGELIVDRTWEGIYLSNPSSLEEEMLLEELAERCHRHGLEEDSGWPGWWEREI